MNAQEIINNIERENNLKEDWNKEKFKLMFYDDEFKRVDENIIKCLKELKR